MPPQRAVISFIITKSLPRKPAGCRKKRVLFSSVWILFSVTSSALSRAFIFYILQKTVYFRPAMRIIFNSKER